MKDNDLYHLFFFIWTYAQYLFVRVTVISTVGSNCELSYSFIRVLLKSYCSVEGYYGSLDTAHDVLADICDDHVIWWPRRGWTESIRNLCTVVLTHNDLCICIVLTKRDSPDKCVNVTENIENFQSKFYNFSATKTSVTVSVKQRQHDRVTRCTFSVDFEEIKTISQSLPSTCAICLQPRQSGRHRGEIETPRLSGPWIFEYEFRDVFPKMYGIPERHLRNDAYKCQNLTQDGMLNMSSW